MTSNEPRRDQPGYRGALPTRNDTLARPWVIIVFAIFLAIIVLSALEIPSRFAPEPTPLPIPSIPATPSAEPEPSGSGSGSGSPEASGSASASATPQP
jgi:energy-converting hydrogenase Eha subunit F